MLKVKLSLLICLFTVASLLTVTAAQKRILVYTKNGTGYVHDNIKASVEALKKIGAENNLIVDVSDDPAVMTPGNLAKYNCLVFSNTNNETFASDEQRNAFKDYIHNGGAFVGIHSACGSERQWPWFWSMLGGKFKRHPKYQPFDLKIIDKNNPATEMLPDIWKWKDECYYLDNLNPDIHVLMVADIKTIEDPQKAEYPGHVFGDYFPLAWYHIFEGARVFYTAIGHDIADYSDPLYVKHITGGILWALGKEVKSKKRRLTPINL
jgi:type 1 glutamine amidotransferase